MSEITIKMWQKLSLNQCWHAILFKSFRNFGFLSTMSWERNKGATGCRSIHTSMLRRGNCNCDDSKDYIHSVHCNKMNYSQSTIKKKKEEVATSCATADHSMLIFHVFSIAFWHCCEKSLSESKRSQWSPNAGSTRKLWKPFCMRNDSKTSWW